jgi:glycosyltransferase involved in cell wall biosynthesis
MANYNIGYTAGIETNFVSPAWLMPSLQMDKIIVISEHAKSGFVNAEFLDPNANAGRGVKYKITTPIEVCHFPVKDHVIEKLNLDLKDDFNFLTVCQWGPRKNLEQTIINFIEEFKNEEVGLVLKINIANDSLLDKDTTEGNLKKILEHFKDRKCSVYLLHGHMSENEMYSLYNHPKIKAIISSTHGEGFGFPLFEAACNELPVVATDWSGHLDFLTMKDEDGAEKKMFAKVDFELKPIAQEHVWQGVLEAGTSWAYPLQGSFKVKMREVYKDYSRFKSWSKKLNKWIREEFSAEKVHTKFINLVAGQFDVEDWLKQMNVPEENIFEHD